MAKIETLSLEVDGILPNTRVFRERCFLRDLIVSTARKFAM